MNISLKFSNFVDLNIQSTFFLYKHYYLKKKKRNQREMWICKLHFSIGCIFLKWFFFCYNVKKLIKIYNFCYFYFQDFDAWFNTNNCFGDTQLVDRLHAVSQPFYISVSMSYPNKFLCASSMMWFLLLGS